MTRYWIMKSEPSEFSILDLQKRGSALWDGVRNYQVRNMMRDLMRPGDKALFYHSSCREVGVVGEMEVIGLATPDVTQFDRQSAYYDAKSNPESPRWIAIEVRHVQTFSTVVSLAVLRADMSLQQLRILQLGNRLSITECTKKEYEHIRRLGQQ